MCALYINYNWVAKVSMVCTVCSTRLHIDLNAFYFILHEKGLSRARMLCLGPLPHYWYLDQSQRSFDLTSDTQSV